MAKKNKPFSKGMIDAAEDLLLDMDREPPDIEDMVFRVNPDGSITKFPATELPKEDW
jgi:hypothetical protein